MQSNPMLEKLLKYAGWLAIALLVYVAILGISALKQYTYIGGGIGSGNVITVTGEGEVFAVADIAEFGFTVFEERATLEEAQTASAEKMNAIIAYLEEEGIEERDIKTSNYSANPRYEYRAGGGAEPMMIQSEGDAQTISYVPPFPGGNERVLVGYEVSQTVNVKVRDTDGAGDILAGVGAMGVDNIYGPNFTIDDEDELRRDARRAAIEDAQEKARELANDLDVRLGSVVAFNENAGGYYPFYADRAEMAVMDMDSAAPVAPDLPMGENKISVTVSVTYEIR